MAFLPSSAKPTAASPATGTGATAATPANPNAARVLICDDSVMIRGALARLLDGDPEIAVVGRVGDGAQALDAVRRLRPDVVVLDIEMPVMDGMTALPQLLRVDPSLRVIMASTLTTRGADIALQALRLGAADYIPKPTALRPEANREFQAELLAKVKGLTRLRRATRPTPPPAPAPQPAKAAPAQRAAAAAPRPAPPAPASAPAQPTLATRPAAAQVPLALAIGSSTGGPQALFTLIQAFRKALPVPVLITQHMPASFTPILAEHIGRLGPMPCTEARDNEAAKPGHIYVAPGDRHMIVGGTAGALVLRLSNDPPENFCRPSVDPMLRSLTTATNGRSLLVMLTGMGHDGLEGTRGLITAGGTAIAQDEASSVVWGMPGAIAKAGLCHAILPLPSIAEAICRQLRVSAC